MKTQSSTTQEPAPETDNGSKTARLFSRKWERFGGLSEAESAEADALMDELQRRGFKPVKPRDAEKIGLTPGEYMCSQWFSLTTNQCSQAEIYYVAEQEVQPACEERQVAA